MNQHTFLNNRRSSSPPFEVIHPLVQGIHPVVQIIQLVAHTTNLFDEV